MVAKVKVPVIREGVVVKSEVCLAQFSVPVMQLAAHVCSSKV